MGVREELAALRKQGVTKKNASDLRYAKGLSTPEAEENSIKVQQERIRIVNYGKEAKNYLKLSPGTKKSMFDSSSIETTGAGKEENSAPAVHQSKDLTSMIQITNDFAFVDEAAEDEGGEGNQNPLDCIFGPPAFCPIDADAVKGGVDDATKSIKDAIDEHVVPRVDGAHNNIMGARNSIRGAIEEHVVPNVENFRVQSMATVDSMKESSQRFLGEVKKDSDKTVEGVRKQSQILLDRSKTAVGGVSAQTMAISATTMAIVNEKVKPGYQNLVDGTQKAVQSTTEKCQTLWSALVEAITVTYAPCYLGTAPGWTNITVHGTVTGSTATIPWYYLLEEASLRAFGRVVFCDNPVTGIFIWLGILCASPLAAFCALLGVLTANVTAIYMGMDQDTIRSGQYARNAVLIGASIVDSFDFVFPAAGNLQSGTSILLFLSFLQAPVTLLVESIWIRKVSNSIPSLLLPYNIVLLVTCLCAKVWNIAMATQIVFSDPAAVVEVDDILAVPSTYFFHEAIFNGLSRIFSVDGHVFAGILILIGVLFCSRIVAGSLLAGAFVSSCFLGYVVFGENHWYLNSGYAGFNPALFTAGIFFYLVPSWKLMGFALFGIAATLIVQGAVDVLLAIMGIPVSTSLGFCIALLPLLSMDMESIFGNPEDYFIRTVPESALSTPEEYLKTIDSSPADQPTDSSSSDDDDEEAPPTNEKTPLL